MPAAVKEKAAAFVASKYHKFSERYGPTGAKLVMGGMVLLLPVPIPGTSLLPVAIAEGVRRLGRLFKGGSDPEPEQYEGDAEALTPETLARFAAQALKELCDEMGEPCPAVSDAQIAHLTATLAKHPEMVGRATGGQPPEQYEDREKDGKFAKKGSGNQTGGTKTEPEKRGGGAASGDKPAPKAEAGRATGREVPKAPARPHTKAVRAAGRLTDVARRRRVIKAVRNEGELADAIGGFNFPDSEPADVCHMTDAAGKPVTTADGVRQALGLREVAVKTVQNKDSTPEQRKAAERLLKQPAHFFEVKTLLTTAKDKVSMSAKAVRRKERWMDRYGVLFSVVLIDDRKGLKYSGNRVHVAPFSLAKTTNLAQCKQSGSMAGVLDHTH